jgi:flagellar hook-associated protein 2
VRFERDATQAIERVRDFVNAYNTLIQRLETLLTERRTGAQRSHQPLTDEEKAHMTERQIDEWQAIARTGIMRNDHGIQARTDSLRRSLFTAVEGAGIMPADIGITTGRFDGGTGGQIILDEDRLREALERDPEQVARLFNGNSAIDAPQSEWGMLRRMDNLLQGFSGVNGTQSRALDSLDRSIREVNDQLERMQDRMWAEEDRLFRQFAAMETALSQMQSQGDWFASMLAGVPGR